MYNGNIDRTKRKVHIALACVSIIFGVGLYFLFRYIIFGGNAVKVYPDGLMSRGPVPDFVFAVAASIALIYACLNLTVGRIIINRFSFMAREQVNRVMCRLLLHFLSLLLCHMRHITVLSLLRTVGLSFPNRADTVCGMTI